MPLSEHEQRLLEQIEQALYAEDPKFATKVRSTTPRTQATRKVLRSVLLVLLGLGIVIAGVALDFVPVGILGFAVMLVAGVLLVRGGTAAAGTATGPAKASRKKPPPTGQGGGGLGGKMEDRWRRRWDDRDM